MDNEVGFLIQLYLFYTMFQFHNKKLAYSLKTAFIFGTNCQQMFISTFENNKKLGRKEKGPNTKFSYTLIILIFRQLFLQVHS